MRAKSVKCEVPAAIPCGYADDTGMTSRDASAVQSTMDSTGTFGSLTGQCLNAKKSNYLSTAFANELLSVHLNGEAATTSDGGRLLGAHVAYRRNVKNELVSAFAGRLSQCVPGCNFWPRLCCPPPCTVFALVA